MHLDTITPYGCMAVQLLVAAVYLDSNGIWHSIQSILLISLLNTLVGGSYLFNKTMHAAHWCTCLVFIFAGAWLLLLFLHSFAASYQFEARSITISSLDVVSKAQSTQSTHTRTDAKFIYIHRHWDILQASVHQSCVSSEYLLFQLKGKILFAIFSDLLNLYMLTSDTHYPI
jgi:hypothetical protein